MTETPTQIEHNIRVVHVITGEHIICNFGQIREEVDGEQKFVAYQLLYPCLLYTSPSPRDATLSRMPSSA